VTVSEGIFNILENRSVSQIGVISKADILDAKQHLADYVDYELIQEVNGGNWFSGIAKFGHNLFEKIKPIAKKIYDIGKKAAPYVETGLKIAKLMGLGQGGVLVGDQEYQYEMGNGAMVGGKMMNRSKLRHRMRR
jgi:hypothetical protein